ncbi:MAG: iron ABC transporter permease [Treponema sp.]|jgi:iron complex transport system permease protein|nr:iron ABC transporter permease [Treponema sp.]
MGDIHTGVLQDYKRLTKRRLVKLTAGLGLCAVSLITDIMIGPSWLKPAELFNALFNPGSVSITSSVIVWTLRLPQALMAIGVGAALGLAGASMQTILNNPLASPYTLGVSTGAGFGAALAIVFGASLTGGVFGAYLVPAFAFAFSILTCMVIYFLARSRNLSSETMILSGIGMSFLFQSLQSFLQYISTPEALQSIVFWLFGSLSKSNWFTVAMIYAALALIMPVMMLDAWKLTALKLGDEKARTLGVHVEHLRIKVFLLISLLTSIAVCFVGVIGFIGMVGPHIARILVGEDQRFFIPLSVIFGAAILSLASVASKLVSHGAMLPIGIIMGFIGVPFFFSLILGKRRVSI